MITHKVFEIEVWNFEGILILGCPNCMPSFRSFSHSMAKILGGRNPSQRPWGNQNSPALLQLPSSKNSHFLFFPPIKLRFLESFFLFFCSHLTRLKRLQSKMNQIQLYSISLAFLFFKLCPYILLETGRSLRFIKRAIDSSFK